MDTIVRICLIMASEDNAYMTHIANLKDYCETSFVLGYEHCIGFLGLYALKTCSVQMLL